MELVPKLSLLTLRHLLAAVCAAPGQDRTAEVAGLLARHCADPRLSAALQRAHGRTWKALEIVLAGESFWDGCQVFLSPEECRTLREKIQALRGQTPLGVPAGPDADLRTRCQRELRKAQQSGLLAEEAIDGQALAQQLSPDGADVQRAAGDLAAELRQAGYPALAALMEPAAPGQTPVPVAALNFFLRRELSAEPALRDLGLDGLRPLPEAQESALALLAEVMAAHGRGLQEWLEEEEPTAAATAAAPAAETGAAAAAAETGGDGKRQRVSLLAWVGTLAVMIVPVLLVVLMVSSHTVREERSFVGHTGAVKSLALAPGGARLYSGGEDKTVRAWDVATGKELGVFKGHDLPVTSLAVAPDGKRLLSADRATVRLWETDGGKELVTLSLPAHALAVVGFTADGPRALSLAGGAKLQLWDVATKQVRRGFAVDADDVQSLALSADAGLALVGGAKKVYLWDLTKQKLRHVLEGHTAAVNAVAFSPDGRRVAAGGMDETVRLWAAASGEKLGVLTGPASPVVSLAFSPSSKLLLSGSGGSKGSVFDKNRPVVDRRTFRLWGVETGRDLCLFEGPYGPVWAVAFSPDGNKVLSGGDDGVVRLWPLPR